MFHRLAGCWPPLHRLPWLALLLILITAGLSFHCHPWAGPNLDACWQAADPTGDDCALCQVMAGAAFNGVQIGSVGLADVPAPLPQPERPVVSRVQLHSPSRAPPSLPLA